MLDGHYYGTLLPTTSQYYGKVAHDKPVPVQRSRTLIVCCSLQDVVCCYSILFESADFCDVSLQYNVRGGTLLVQFANE